MTYAVITKNHLNMLTTNRSSEVKAHLKMEDSLLLGLFWQYLIRFHMILRPRSSNFCLLFSLFLIYLKVLFKVNEMTP